ncbi:MAG: menaquinol-cytochrome c reductase iron-sulfur subunit [Chloroflexota bacterium]|jgi:menaquinol-cytochrome c reductase iron-sulfur subunit|nr:menaquinol-cytochrome c reductase iron-sulfur subunit [Chloroflexota bacterium]
MTRRRFAVWGTAVSGALVSLTLGIPIVGFLLSPLFQRREKDVERRLGFVGDMPEGQPVRYEISLPQNAWPVPDQAHTVFVVRTGSNYEVLSNTCTHMQCPVRFQKDINQFLCPCHGGLYDIHGNNLGGPPPRPLAKFTSRVDADGVLYIRSSLGTQL